jgi:hypothetical protein
MTKSQVIMKCVVRRTITLFWFPLQKDTKGKVHQLQRISARHFCSLICFKLTVALYMESPLPEAAGALYVGGEAHFLLIGAVLVLVPRHVHEAVEERRLLQRNKFLQFLLNITAQPRRQPLLLLPMV